jgi:E3 ubiquitin-protein ligase RNF5
MECVICLETITEDGVVTTCGHLYHWRCLFRWLSTGQNNTCPSCKATVTRDNIIPVYSSSSSSSSASAAAPSSSSGGQEPGGRPAANEGTAAEAAASSGTPSSGSSNNTSGADEAIPERPRARRPPAPEDPRSRHAFWQQQANPAQAGAGGPAGAARPGGVFQHPGGGTFVYSAGFGLFPSLFGLQFQSFGLGAGDAANNIREINGRRVRIMQDGREVPVTPEEERQEMLSRVLLWLGILVVFMLLFL